MQPILPEVRIPIDIRATHTLAPNDPINLMPGTVIYAVTPEVMPGKTGTVIVAAGPQDSITVVVRRGNDPVGGISYNEDQRRRLFEFVRRFAQAPVDGDTVTGWREEAESLMDEYGKGLPL